MTCMTLTDLPRRLLTAPTAGPLSAVDLAKGDVLDELRRWGWVFGREWVELTGAGPPRRDGGWWAGGLVGRWAGRSGYPPRHGHPPKPVKTPRKESS